MVAGVLQAGTFVRYQEREQAFEQVKRGRRTAADVKIDRHDGGDAAGNGIASGEDAAVERAVADRDDPFRIGRRIVGALQRLAHIGVTGPVTEQHVGMAGRGDEAQAEAFEIVEGIVQRVDLELAAVARAGIDLADRQAAAEPPARRAIDARGELGERRVVGAGAALGERRRCTRLSKKQSCASMPPRDRAPNRSS